MMKTLPRRTFLRGLGTAIALPYLDAMGAPAARTASKPPVRLAYFYVPNGIVMRDWTPATEGASFELPALLKPLAPFKDDMLVLSGLTHNNGRALGDGPGDHARAASTFLTGVHPRKTAGADMKLGVSADQVAANAIGSATRFRSLELGLEDGRMVGGCDSGYSCAYSNSISWAGEATPIPPEINPRLLFERLFGTAGSDESPAAKLRREKYNRSILDYALQDASKLKGELGRTDQRKLDEYLTGIREIEKRIQLAESNGAKEFTPNLEKPEGVPIDFAEHAKIMMELLAIAFETDMTRVATFMIGREGSNRTYKELNVSDGHHSLTHHRGNEDWIKQIVRINNFHVELFANFIARLKATREGDGTLLDHSMIVYGSGLSDGNRHQHNDLPVVVLGRAAGNLKPGRHIRYAQETPMTNLFLSQLDLVGVRPESLGDSNGRLNYLTSLA